MNRETWLTEAITHLTELFEARGYTLPKVHVSTGWPSKGGTRAKNRVVGECWKPQTSEDGASHIFISPTQSDSVTVLGVLVHELIHAWDKGESGHRGAFVQAAKDLGLTAPWTATQVGPELTETLNNVVSALGAYPHAPLTSAQGPQKKQTTRMVKVVSDCDHRCVARTSRKWLNEGQFSCPHGGIMSEDDV